VADVQTLAARIRKHIEDVVFGSGGIEVFGFEDVLSLRNFATFFRLVEISSCLYVAHLFFYSIGVPPFNHYPASSRQVPQAARFTTGLRRKTVSQPLPPAARIVRRIGVCSLRCLFTAVVFIFKSFTSYRKIRHRCRIPFRPFSPDDGFKDTRDLKFISSGHTVAISFGLSQPGL
jgi:hypothetical protein